MGQLIATISECTGGRRVLERSGGVNIHTQTPIRWVPRNQDEIDALERRWPLPMFLHVHNNHWDYCFVSKEYELLDQLRMEEPHHFERWRLVANSFYKVPYALLERITSDVPMGPEDA
jgi:hypothetical protein